MPAAWETWTLVWLAALQFAVAYWWWKGPHLEGTRAWVAALFVLNGAATVLNLLGETPGIALAGALGSAADNGTNLALFAVGVVGLDVHDRWPRLRNALLGVLGVYCVAAIVGWFPSKVAGTAQPSWTRPATAHLLLVAIVVGGAAIVRRARRWDEDENALWTLALAGLGLRYAELSAWLYLPPSVPSLDGSALPTANRLLQLVGFLTMVAALAALLWGYHRSRPKRNRRFHELTSLLLLAGLLFGTGRSLHDVSFLGLVFTFAVVRPLVFLEVETRLDGSRHLAPFRRPLLLGAGGLAGALVGTVFAAAVGMDGAGALLTGAATAPAGAWLAGLLGSSRAREGVPLAGNPGGEDRRDWPVDDEDVTLPPDWRDRLEAGQRRYAKLDPEVRDALDDLAHWERIVLALDGAPDGDDLPPYERTTPGLHLLTHCPYASVGPEVRRANERSRSIAEELGVETGPGAASRDLVEDDWGRARGLDSPRAKHYELTRLGERVAEALRENLGLGEAAPEEVARLVADGYRDPR